MRCREVKGGKLGLARGSEAPHTFFAVGFRAAAAQRSVHRPCRPRRRGSHRHGRAHLDCSRWASPRACIRRVRPGVEPGHIQSDHQHSFRPIASTRLTSCLELSTPRSQSSRRPVCEPSSRTGPPHAQGLTLLHQQRRHTRPGERPSSSSSSSLGKAVVIDFVVRAWRALMHVESVGACWSRITRASREKLA